MAVWSSDLFIDNQWFARDDLFGVDDRSLVSWHVSCVGYLDFFELKRTKAVSSSQRVLVRHWFESRLMTYLQSVLEILAVDFKSLELVEIQSGVERAQALLGHLLLQICHERHDLLLILLQLFFGV